jgi:RNA-directed DNA polymerase
MFPIYRATELADYLSTTVAEIETILSEPELYYEELVLIDPRKSDREPRPVLSAKKPLSTLQSRFYNRILLPALSPSLHSHGGTKGRSIKTNAQPHLKSDFVLKTDISNFYPSIHDRRVYRFFRDRLGCPAAVAEICCRLCTHKHELSLGLCTSPILADQLLTTVDHRISAACQKLGLVYTRYVDDITISGSFNLKGSGVQRLVARILNNHGFAAKKSKTDAKPNGKITITGVRVKRGKLDVDKLYADELERQIADAKSLADDGTFAGPYYTRRQILGRIQFVGWVNPGRERMLRYAFNRVSWMRAKENAISRGYRKTIKRVVARDYLR